MRGLALNVWVFCAVTLALCAIEYFWWRLVWWGDEQVISWILKYDATILPIAPTDLTNWWQCVWLCFRTLFFATLCLTLCFRIGTFFSLFSVCLCVASDCTTWPMVDNVASLVSLGEVYNRFGGRQLWCRWLYELHGGGLQENNGCRWMGGWRSDSYAAGDCLDPGMPAPQPPPRPGRPRDPPPTPKTSQRKGIVGLPLPTSTHHHHWWHVQANTRGCLESNITLQNILDQDVFVVSNNCYRLWFNKG